MTIIRQDISQSEASLALFALLEVLRRRCETKQSKPFYKHPVLLIGRDCLLVATNGSCKTFADPQEAFSKKHAIIIR